jgi:hypothetical protein
MSLLWVTAAVRPLPIEEGLYWRLHHHGRPFSQADATSEPFNKPEFEDDFDEYETYGDPGSVSHEEYFAPRKGYSAYANPHHVHQYVEERGLHSHNGDIVGFHGHHVGWGVDDEPLVMPDSDQPAHRMPYREFEQRLEHTPKPEHPLELDEDDGSDWF